MEERVKKELLKLSKKAYKKNEIPVSALIVRNNKIIARAYNKKNIKRNALFHAEIICLQKAYRKLRRWNLNDCIMYVSLEPCSMCRSLIEESRIKDVFYILKKGEITNKYKKTRYEQMYDCDKDFSIILSNFFENMRK